MKPGRDSWGSTADRLQVHAPEETCDRLNPDIGCKDLRTSYCRCRAVSKHGSPTDEFSNDFKMSSYIVLFLSTIKPVSQYQSSPQTQTRPMFPSRQSPYSRRANPMQRKRETPRTKNNEAAAYKLCVSQPASHTIKTPFTCSSFLAMQNPIECSLYSLNVKHKTPVFPHKRQKQTGAFPCPLSRISRGPSFIAR